MTAQGILIPVPGAGDHGKKLVSLKREVVEGIRVFSGWGNLRNSPAFPQLLRDPDNPYSDLTHRPWLDHLYRLKYPDGTVVFRSEPYWLYRDGWKDLEEIEDNGWSVTIGGYAWHYVTTVVISIERAD